MNAPVLSKFNHTGPWISIAVGVRRAAVTSAVATCKNATATTRIAEPYRDSRLDPEAKHRLRPAVFWSARRRGEEGGKIKREGAEVFNMRQASSGDGMMGIRCRAAMAEARDKQQ